MRAATSGLSFRALLDFSIFSGTFGVASGFGNSLVVWITFCDSMEFVRFVSGWVNCAWSLFCGIVLGGLGQIKTPTRNSKINVATKAITRRPRDFSIREKNGFGVKSFTYDIHQVRIRGPRSHLRMAPRFTPTRIYRDSQASVFARLERVRLSVSRRIALLHQCQSCREILY